MIKSTYELLNSEGGFGVDKKYSADTSMLSSAITYTFLMLFDVRSSKSIAPVRQIFHLLCQTNNHTFVISTLWYFNVSRTKNCFNNDNTIWPRVSTFYSLIHWIEHRSI